MTSGRGRRGDVPRRPGAEDGRDPSPAVVMVAAFVALAGVAWLDLTDGSLGSAFSIGFVLVVITAPLAIELRSIVLTGALPPVLLILTLLGIVLVDPTAVQVNGLAADAGAVPRTLASTLDHGLTLVIGHTFAIAMIVLRNAWASRGRPLAARPA